MKHQFRCEHCGRLLAELNDNVLSSYNFRVIDAPNGEVNLLSRVECFECRHATPINQIFYHAIQNIDPRDRPKRPSDRRL